MLNETRIAALPRPMDPRQLGGSTFLALPEEGHGVALAPPRFSRPCEGTEQLVDQHPAIATNVRLTSAMLAVTLFVVSVSTMFE